VTGDRGERPQSPQEKPRRRKRRHGEYGLRERSPGLWEAKASVGWVPATDESGRQIGMERRVLYAYGRGEGEKGQRAALRAIAEKVADYNRGMLGDAGRTTMAQLMAQWLAQHRGRSGRGLTESSRTVYGVVIRKQLEPLLGSTLVRDFEPRRGGALRYGQFQLALQRLPLSESRRSLVDTVLRAVLDYARRMRLLAENPADALPRMQASKPQPRALSPDGLAAVLAQTDRDPHFGPLLRFLASTGARLSEGRLLKWEDVNLEQGIAFVRQSKTAAGERVLVLPPSLVRALRRLPQSSEYVFPNPETGQPWSDVGVQTAFRRAARAAGLEGISPKILRSTYLTAGARTGAHPKTLQEQAGHSSERITARFYINPDLGMRRKLAEDVERDLGLDRGADRTGQAG